MRRKYQKLLPAPPAHASSSHSNPSGLAKFTNRFIRKRIAVTTACNPCRSRKIRCDGGRPACFNCRKRGAARCEYNNNKNSRDASAEKSHVLGTSSETEALEKLRTPRANYGHDMADPPHRTLSQEMEPTPAYVQSDDLIDSQSSLESELMAKNPAIFPPRPSISKFSLEMSHLLRPTEKIQERRPVERQYSPQEREDLEQGDLDSASPHVTTSSVSGECKHTTIHHALPAKLCDERLYNLKISYWTSVQMPDELAATILSLYLETDHPLLGTFEPGLFISDLVNHQHTNCSPFLVSSLLYWGCQLYGAIDEKSVRYASQFLLEAEQLYSLLEGADSALNMVACQTLSLACMGGGMDDKVLVYQSAAVNMGTRLGLFGVDSEVPVSNIEKIPETTIIKNSFAAWGVFNCLVTLFYRKPGYVYINYPPTLPIPGSFDEGELVGAPTAQNVFPSYMGITFSYVCQFCQIMSEVSLVYLSHEEEPQKHTTLLFAEMKYREILAWAENLPTSVLRHAQRQHHVIILHMWIHAAILDILRPFTGQNLATSKRLKTFSATGSTTTAAWKASVNQLKVLTFIYRRDFPPSTYTVLFQPALTYLVTSVLREPHDPSWRLWFLLCLYGYETSRQSWRVSEAIGTGLLSLTLRDTDLSANEARGILHDIKARALDISDSRTIRAPFMGDPNLAVTDSRGATMEDLASDFNMMLLVKDYTYQGEDTVMS